MTTTSAAGSGGGPFAALALREIFASEGEEDDALGLPVLATFARSLAERQAIHWYASTVIPADTTRISTTIGAYQEPSDWTEIDISIRSWTTRSGRQPTQWQRLWSIWSSLEVACWCVTNHNIHRVHEVTFEAGSPDGVKRACDATLTLVDRWIVEGLLPADMWRRRAGLPLREVHE